MVATKTGSVDLLILSRLLLILYVYTLIKWEPCILLQIMHPQKSVKSVAVLVLLPRQQAWSEGYPWPSLDIPAFAGKPQAIHRFRSVTGSRIYFQDAFLKQWVRKMKREKKLKDCKEWARKKVEIDFRTQIFEWFYEASSSKHDQLPPIKLIGSCWRLCKMV